MSENPPAFAPDPSRRRPSSTNAKPVGEHADEPDVERIPLAERPLPAAPTPADQLRSADAPSPASPPAGPQPPADEHPRVLGIGADDARARQWRIDTGASHPLAGERLDPSTADQPTTRPPSYPPARAPQGAPAPRAATMPPAYAPQRAEAARTLGRSHTTPGARSGAPARTGSPRPQWPAPQTPRTAPGVERPRRKRRRKHPVARAIALLLVLLLAWVVFLLWDANSHLGRTEALSGGADTPGTTYLLAGSDSRADGAVQDGFEGGERSDSIMLVNIAPNGQAAAISIPRDAFAEIPDYGWDKINASYAYGGSDLLVQSVEKLTGLTVDHYVQVGMGGVSTLVDALGGVELCYDADVSDAYSGLEWQAGCHTVDGTTALAFSRMRYSDPEGDIGRTKRQRQVITEVISATMSPSTFLNPVKTLRVERAGASSFTIDDGSTVLDIAKLVLAFRSASNSGLMGTPPIASIDYTTASGGSAVLLEDETAPDFFAKVRAGSLASSDLNIVAGQ